MIREEWRPVYKWVARLTCPFSLGMALLLTYDLSMPSRRIDQAIIIGKHVSRSRYGNSYVVAAIGKFKYSEAVPREFYDRVSQGMIIDIELSPIFSEWKRVHTEYQGNSQLTARGTDLRWMFCFSIVFLTTAIAYAPDRILFRYLITVIALPLINVISIVLWIKVAMLWMGHIDKV